MEPLNLATFVVFVSLLTLAAALEILGLCRFTISLSGLLKRRSPTGAS